MPGSPHVCVSIDLGRVRANARDVAARAGVPVWATVKADAYGLGAARVAVAIRDLVAGFCVFSLGEATAAGLWERTGRPTIALGPPATLDPGPWLAARVRPSVTTVAQARALAAARPILCVDTGMQRFACPAEGVRAVLATGVIDEAFTHATRAEHARALREIVAAAGGGGADSGGRGVRLHAAASSLVGDADARLDLVRPGLAIYAGAVTVTAPLADVRRSVGAIGYNAWRAETGHHGAVLAGYAHGLRPGPALVNGRRQRVAEVGMQTAYVTLDPADRVGDRVTLLGEGLGEAEVAFAWGASPHQVLVTLARAGERGHVG